VQALEADGEIKNRKIEDLGLREQDLRCNLELQEMLHKWLSNEKDALACEIANLTNARRTTKEQFEKVASTAN